MKIVYVETSIPSFMFETRQKPATIGMRRSTEWWWHNCSQSYELVTSTAVLAELDSAPEPKRSSAMNLIRAVRILEPTAEVQAVTQVYINERLMPDNAVGDALHLAFASVHKIDYLLTWNCKHLANANKFQQIRIVNTRLGLFIPTLTTPQALIPEAP
jgi:hypothetical protein